MTTAKFESLEEAAGPNQENPFFSEGEQQHQSQGGWEQGCKMSASHVLALPFLSIQVCCGCCIHLSTHLFIISINAPLH